jgi:hypothetical protein
MFCFTAISGSDPNKSSYYNKEYIRINEDLQKWNEKWREISVLNMKQIKLKIKTLL